MPETIGSHGLYCPDFDDYAAVALYMQSVGTIIDASLQEQRVELLDFLAPPAILLTNSGARVIPVSSTINDLFDTIVINTSTFMTYDFTSEELLIGSPIGAPVTVPYRRGAYNIGGGVRMSATGAVTVGSNRRFSIQVNNNAVFPSPLIAPFDNTIDQNTGGNEGLNVKSNFTLLGTSGVSVQHSASSGNAASTTTIPAGSAFLWCVYMGPTDVLEVA